MLLKMNKQFSAVILIAGLLTSALQGQTITTPDSRSEVLDGMKSTLANVERPEGEYTEVKSPFEARIIKKAEPVIKKLDDAPKTVVGAVLPDDKALSIISQQFQPLGSLVLGDRGILQMQGNHNIEKGDSFKAEIKGHIYEVKISDVTSRGYTLQLGTAQVSKNFLTTTGTAE